MTYSFIIPVYNCKGYLEHCVSSILAMDITDYEIILVDDGSGDGSSQLCDTLAYKFPQVKVIHQENSGVSAARNRGLQAAGGEFIIFLDSDDTIDSLRLGEILKDERCQNADLTVFGMSFDYYYHGKMYRQDKLFHDYDGVMTKSQWGQDFVKLYKENSLSSMCNKIFKRNLLSNMELNSTMFLYEDLEFCLRYLCCCSTIFNVPEAVYHYRQCEDEGNAGRRLKRINSIPELLQPIENAIFMLCKTNGALTQSIIQDILLRLYMTLAREKIAVSGLHETHRVCRDFAAWCNEKSISPTTERTSFFHHLMKGRSVRLLLAARKSAIRHKLAVWAKGNGLYKKG